MAKDQSDGLPTSTVHQARLQVYQPTRRPKACAREIETPWGRARIDGKLGQAHADFVEAVLRNAVTWREDDAGRLHVRVDPHRVRISMGGGKKASYEQTWAVARDVMRALISLSFRLDGRAIRVEGHIIDLIKESQERVPDPLRVGDGAANGDRALWEVAFGASYVRLLGEDLRRDYDPQPLARLATGVAQAVARFVFTHQHTPEGGWRVDTLIDAVGAGGEAIQAKRDRRRELKRDAVGLAAVGIVLAGDRVFRERRGASAPLRRANAPPRGASAPCVEHSPQGGRTFRPFRHEPEACSASGSTTPRAPPLGRPCGVPP